MRFLKLLCIVLMAMLISAAFLACSKSKNSLPGVSADKTPLPAQPASDSSVSIIGFWSGQYFGAEKSIPVYFGFHIKDKGELDVLDAEKKKIGSGSWALDGNSFKALYTLFEGKNICSFHGELYNSPAKLSGTWGYGNSNNNGGIWDMIKM